MTESTPTESVAACELTRYPPEKVLALIEAANALVAWWRADGEPNWLRGRPKALLRAVDALTEGSTDRE
jgi:hypothetical protein